MAWFARGLSLTFGALLVLLLWNQIDDAHAAEAHACLLSIVAGTNLVAAANDLVGLFLALELVSIPTYVILYLVRRDRGTREATIKYFLLSVFSSALVLYGMSWLYGAAGTTNLAGIAEVARAAGPRRRRDSPRRRWRCWWPGWRFRITAVPFHFYAPDVFQGVPASNAAMLSFIPKVVGFVALVRLLPLTGATLTTRLWLPGRIGPVAVGDAGRGHDVRRQPDGAAAEAPVPADGLFQHRARRLHAGRPGGGQRRRRSAARARCCSTWPRTA